MTRGSATSGEASISSATLPSDEAIRADRGIWARWVAANMAAETVGLVVTAAVAVAVAHLGDSGRGVLVAAAAMALVAAGAFEGGVVGYAQWRVLRRPLPALSARSWIVVTVLGAVVAWSAGLVPSTLMSMSDQGGGEPPLGLALQLLLAAAMGLVLGPVLGVPQWWVLRGFVDRAGWWVAANAVAWAAGMPVIFLVAGRMPADASAVIIVAGVLAGCAVTGAVVGAVHGTWLVWLLRAASEPPPAARASVRERG
jgi:hypothetical protein